VGALQNEPVSSTNCMTSILNRSCNQYVLMCNPFSVNTTVSPPATCASALHAPADEDDGFHGVLQKVTSSVATRGLMSNKLPGPPGHMRMSWELHPEGPDPTRQHACSAQQPAGRLTPQLRCMVSLMACNSWCQSNKGWFQCRASTARAGKP
jgi:hypothetical protein